MEPQTDITITLRTPDQSPPPVLYVGGQGPYGPMDETPAGPAREVVLRWGRDLARTEEELLAAARFLKGAWFSASHAARVLGYARTQSLEHAIRDGRLPVSRSDGTRLICGADLLHVETPGPGRPAG